MRFALLALALPLFATLAAAADQPTVVLSEEEAADGFTLLFDGQSLDLWQGSLDGYLPEPGGLLVSGEEGSGRLFTKKEYANFIFRFEFRLAAGGNNGIGVRAPLEGHTSRDGMEIQILDDTSDRYKDLKPYQFHGSVYGMVPAERGHLNPVGEWNREEIVCDGSRIKVTLNGVVIVDTDLDDIGETTMDGHPHPGRFRKSGRLAFLGHGARVEFRNLRVKELADDFVCLFDGKTFNGWEGNLTAFRIEDNAIVGGSLERTIPKNEYLCTERAYDDFELRLKFKVLGEGANAGVQIRSHRVPNSNEMIGYQADLGEGIWGMLYDERRHKLLVGPCEEEQAKWINSGQWNDYVIRCEGRRVRFWINGQATVDYTEPDVSIPQTGVIGLQIHQGQPAESWYKEITIRELAPTH